MKEEIKHLWIDALTSGEYKQSKNALNRDGGMCCLGVLCDLYNKETGKGKWYKEVPGDNSNTSFVINSGAEDYLLPPQVMKWAGLKTDNGELYDGKVLTDLNDSGVKFKKIAKLIEKYL